MFTRAFLRDLAERAIRTFAQAWIALLAGDQIGLIRIPWGADLGVAGLAALLAVLNYIVAAPTQASAAAAAPAAKR